MSFLSDRLHYINIIVALSNLIGLFGFKFDVYGFVLLYAISASFIYHLSETKHGLPGIYPLNRYSNEFLNLDRFGAFFAIFTAITCGRITPTVLNYGLVGIITLAISERDIIAEIYGYTVSVSYLDFAISHCLWHALAYYCYWLCFYSK
jgi:hypothetical protein